MAEQLTSAVAVLHQQAVCAEVVDTLEEVVCAAAEYSLVVAEVCEAAEEEVASLAAEEDAGRRYSLEFRV